jgi:hypothetical protein
LLYSSPAATSGLCTLLILTAPSMHHDPLRDLYPTLNEEELRIVKENLDRYLEIAWEIMEEMEDGEKGP